MSAKAAFIILIALTLLSFRFYFFYHNLPHYNDGQYVRFKTTLAQEPKLQDGRQEVTVTTDDGFRVSITTGSSPLYHFGDRLFIEGLFTKKHFKGNDLWVMYFPKVQIANNEQNIITSMALSIKNKANTLYNKTLPPVSASLLSGMVFGGNQGLPDDFTKYLRNVGALHIIAASGMNVSFVAGALMYMLGAVLKRQSVIMISCAGIVFYTFIAGFESSIVRAAVMALIAFSAGILGRQNIVFISIFITGYLMLFIKPVLLTDISFQLSFLSTLGILLIQPFLPLKQFPVIGEDLRTTLSAQIATVPVMFGMFGSYGLLSVLVNALILWTVPLLMALGSLAIILGYIFEPLAKLLLFLALPFLLYFEKIVSYFGALDWTLGIETFPVPMVVGYYFILSAVIISLHKKNNRKRVSN